MNKEKYYEAKIVLDKITQALDEGNLSEDEKQNLELSRTQLSGQLLSIWLPFDWTRRSIMATLFLVGIYGLIQGNTHFLWAWPALVLFSPRMVGEISLFIGKLFGVLR